MFSTWKILALSTYNFALPNSLLVWWRWLKHASNYWRQHIIIAVHVYIGDGSFFCSTGEVRNNEKEPILNNSLWAWSKDFGGDRRESKRRVVPSKSTKWQRPNTHTEMLLATGRLCGYGAAIKLTPWTNSPRGLLSSMHARMKIVVTSACAH